MAVRKKIHLPLPFKGLEGYFSLFLALLLVFPAHATEPKTQDQLAGLFIQGCLPFAGNASALRAWAATNKLPTLPEPATKAFLLGAPGLAFDASAPGAKLALASSDDGLCSAITDKAISGDVAKSLEAGLKQAGIAFRLVIDRDDPKAKDLHFREYLATRTGRSWRILAATVNNTSGDTPGSVGGGQAMLTAAPE